MHVVLNIIQDWSKLFDNGKLLKNIFGLHSLGIHTPIGSISKTLALQAIYICQIKSFNKKLLNLIVISSHLQYF